MPGKLRTCDRRLGTILLAEVVTVNTERVGLGVFAIDPSRCADHRLCKVAPHDEEYSFSDDGDILRRPTKQCQVGESVKAGTQTGLTSGMTVDKVKVVWNLAMPGEVDCACHAVLGTDDYPGTWATFADNEDSVSALVRLIHEADHPVPMESRVVKSELIGIVFGISRMHQQGAGTLLRPVSCQSRTSWLGLAKPFNLILAWNLRIDWKRVAPMRCWERLGLPLTLSDRIFVI